MEKIIDIEKYNEKNPWAKVFVWHNKIKIDVYRWQMLIWLDPPKQICCKKITKEKARKVILDTISEMSPLIKDEIWEKIEPKIMQENKRFLYELHEGAKVRKKSCMYKVE